MLTVSRPGGNSLTEYKNYKFKKKEIDPSDNEGIKNT